MLRIVRTGPLPRSKFQLEFQSSRKFSTQSFLSWQATRQRSFADQNKIDRAILPGSRSSEALSERLVLPNTTISSNVPKEPPSPADVRSDPPRLYATGVSVDPASSSPSPRPRRRFRNFLVTFFVLAAIGYSGGIYYSLTSDNFHDFFTEYVPFGEDAVAYFEEREFRKRFPKKDAGGRSWGQTRGESKITIGRSSGLHPKVSEKSDASGAGTKDKADIEPQNLKSADSALVSSPSAATEEVAVMQHKSAVDQKTEVRNSESPTARRSTSADTPISVTRDDSSSLASVDHLGIEQADEPIIQNAVKMANNVITALSDTSNATQFANVIDALKQDLVELAQEVGILKAKQSQESANKLASAHRDFDDAAKELVRRVEKEMQEQEIKWREEYENEREKLEESYRKKIANELDLQKQIKEQENRTNLLDQEVTLQRQYMESVRAKVSEERHGRLSRLDDLAASVDEMQRITGESGRVIDSVVSTQHLQVAVEAIKARIMNSAVPTPFMDELIALKSVGQDDDVVNAAISCIHPSAYQQGVASLSQLIDRFRRVAAEVRKAALLPEDAGLASHAASAVLSRLMFQKKAERGLPAGDDVEATLARAEALLEEGDLDLAAREVNGLQGWAGVLSRDWVGECRRVLEVRQSLEVISAQARLKGLLVL